MTTTKAYRPGFSGRRHMWRGVVRDTTGTIVWECDHTHRNRDHASANYSAARTCAENEARKLNSGTK